MVLLGIVVLILYFLPWVLFWPVVLIILYILWRQL